MQKGAGTARPRLFLNRIGYARGRAVPAPITALETFHDEPAQERGGRGTVRRFVVGKLRLAQGEFKGAAVGDLAAVREQLGVGGEELLHFGWGPEMVFRSEEHTSELQSRGLISYA